MFGYVSKKRYQELLDSHMELGDELYKIRQHCPHPEEYRDVSDIDSIGYKSCLVRRKLCKQLIFMTTQEVLEHKIDRLQKEMNRLNEKLEAMNVKASKKQKELEELWEEHEKLECDETIKSE